MKRIIIADVNSFCHNGTMTGHGIAVAKNFLGVLAKTGRGQVAGGPAYAAAFPDAVILKHNADSTRNVIRNKWGLWANMRELFRACKNDTIIMQSSGVVTMFLGLALFKPKGIRIFSVQYNTMAINSPLKRLLYRFCAGKIDGIICPTEHIGKAYGRPYCVVPDYIYTEANGTTFTDYSSKIYDFCMVGLIYPDKGMVPAAKRLAATPYRVIIAGKPATPQIEAELCDIAASAPNIELRLRYLDSQEYTDIIRSSRYCILNYSGAYSEHSSGVVYDILFNGLPVVGSQCRSLQFIRQEGVGYLFDSIETWEPAPLLSQERYDDYRRHIAAYYQTHRAHQEKLLSFLLTAEPSE